MLVVDPVDQNLHVIEGGLRRGEMRVPAASLLGEQCDIIRVVTFFLSHKHHADRLFLEKSSFRCVSLEATREGRLNRVLVSHLAFDLMPSLVVDEFLDRALLEVFFVDPAVPSVVDFLDGEKGRVVRSIVCGRLLCKSRSRKSNASSLS